MERICLRLTVLMAAMMMTMTMAAKTQDWGGRVIDEKGEPMPFVNVVLHSLFFAIGCNKITFFATNR